MGNITISSRKNRPHRKSLYRQSYPKEYKAWNCMYERCYNKKRPNYVNYGARGIIICERWLNCFDDFFTDMGPRPSADHSVDRIDNDGPYSPENCKWATRKEQCRNKRSNRFFTHNGETKALCHWCSDLNLSYSTIHNRIRKGWSFADAITRPKKNMNQADSRLLSPT